MASIPKSSASSRKATDNGPESNSSSKGLRSEASHTLSASSSETELLEVLQSKQAAFQSREAEETKRRVMERKALEKSERKRKDAEAASAGGASINADGVPIPKTIQAPAGSSVEPSSGSNSGAPPVSSSLLKIVDVAGVDDQPPEGVPLDDVEALLIKERDAKRAQVEASAEVASQLAKHQRVLDLQVEADKKAERIRLIRVDIAAIDAAAKSLEAAAKKKADKVPSSSTPPPPPKRSRIDPSGASPPSLDPSLGNLRLPFGIGGPPSGPNLNNTAVEVDLHNSSGGGPPNPSGVPQSALLDSFLLTHGLMLTNATNTSAPNSGSSSSGLASIGGGQITTGSSTPKVSISNPGFIPRAPSSSELVRLSKFAGNSDAGACMSGLYAIDIFQGLVNVHKSAQSSQLVERASKLCDLVPGAGVPPSEEDLMAAWISFFTSPALVSRVMSNPRAMLALNSFLSRNRNHFSWIDEVVSGGRKPLLVPFPPDTTARTLLRLFWQYVLLIMGVDVSHGIALGGLALVAEELLHVYGEDVTTVIAYIEEVRMSVSLGASSSIMLSIQDSVLSVIKASANKKVSANGGPGVPASVVPSSAALAPKGVAVIPVGGGNRNPDTHKPFRPSGFGGYAGRGRDDYAGRGRDDKRDGQIAPKLIASATRDSIKQWVSCDDFNSARGCSNSASACFYAHVCCNCCETSHGYSSHSSFTSSQARAMVPFSVSSKDQHGTSKSQ